MSQKRIYLRKVPRGLRLGLAARPTAEKRMGLTADAKASYREGRLRRLGMEQMAAEQRAAIPEQKDAFQRLGHVEAYVVNATHESIDQEARELLEPDYIAVPNIELSIPTPQLGTRLFRRPRGAEFWPQESGVHTAHSQGITGEGAVVVVLDTGCDADHLELRRRRIDFRYVPLEPSRDPMRPVRGFDTHGHGTHVCGIIAGEKIGVAPGVELMVAAVIESETHKTSLERVVVALDWVLSLFEQPAYVGKPIIVNMSLGFLPAWIDQPDEEAVEEGMKVLLSTLVEFDVLPIVAIGNEGAGVMRAPGYYAEALAVGAVDSDRVSAWFSGGGLSPFTGEAKPDIAGYGVDIFSSLERDSRNRSQYAYMSGTSMATPYVTGIAALVASANPGLMGSTLREELLGQAMPLPEDAERVGAGLVRFV